MISRIFYIFFIIFVFQKCVECKISVDHTNNITNPQTKEHTQFITATTPNKLNYIVTKQIRKNLENINTTNAIDNSVQSRKSTTNQTGELIAESSSLARVETTYTSSNTKCNLQMSNGDTKSVRKDRCECAEGFEIIDYDEFKSTIAPTCVEVVTESTLKPTTAQIKMSVNVGKTQEVNMSTPPLKSTEADYLHNIFYTSITNPSTSFSTIPNSNPSVKIPFTTLTNFDESSDNITDTTIKTTTGDITHTDITYSTTGFSIISNSTVNSEFIWRNKSDYTSTTTSNIIILAPIQRKKDHPTDDVELPNIGAFNHASKERNTSQLIYYITGGALIGVMLNVLVILYLWNFKEKGHYKVLHTV